MRTTTPIRLALAALALAVVPTVRAEDPPKTEAPRGFIGINMAPVPLIPPEGRRELGITVDQGVVVVGVAKDGPAAKAGMKVGDILVKLNGKPVPDTSTIVPHDQATIEAWNASLAAIGRTVHVADEVEVVVSREGKELPLKAVAIDAAALQKLAGLEEDDDEDGDDDEGEDDGEDDGEDGDDEDDLPPLADAGAPQASKEDFERTFSAPPPSTTTWFPATGQWTVEPEEGAAPANHVLRQGRPTDPWAVTIHAGPGLAYANGVAKVRFQPVSGMEDAAGGIVFRAQDAKNYYLVRANGLEGNFRLYVVKDGVRSDLASVDVKAPALRTWHVIEVRFEGDSLRATLDGAAVLEAKDASYANGWTGLWTKADSVTLFDDLEVTPSAPKPSETK